MDLARAIQHAVKVNSWFSNSMPGEMPPKWMWPYDDEIKEHFDQVRKERRSGNSTHEEDDDMDENELAADFRR